MPAPHANSFDFDGTEEPIVGATIRVIEIPTGTNLAALLTLCPGPALADKAPNCQPFNFSETQTPSSLIHSNLGKCVALRLLLLAKSRHGRGSPKPNRAHLNYTP